MEHFVEIIAGHMLDAGAEKAQCCFLAVGAFGPKVGNALRRFQGAAGRHDFAPDQCQAGIFQGALIGLLQAMDDLRLALGAEHW